MKKFIASTSAALMVAPSLAMAATYDTTHVLYPDVSARSDAAVSISVLTDEGVVEGNPDGTFRPNALLNRAEYTKIIMNLAGNELVSVLTPCFPDVPVDAWYAPYVCTAKASGIVSGNARIDLPQSEWRFEPVRSVQYEEALKILVKTFAIPTVNRTNDDWYDPYIRAANDYAIGIVGLQPGDPITRGEMARLAVSFMAYADGDLDDLRAAEQRAMSSSSSSSAFSSSASSISSSSSSSSSSASSVSARYDDDDDLSDRSSFLQLGTESHVMGSVRVTSSLEPVDITDVTINLVSGATSLDAFDVYLQADGRYLGTATRRSATEYGLQLGFGSFRVGKQESVSFYMRPRLKAHLSGGTSGQSIQIDDVEVTGTGQWSTSSFSRTSTETFNVFQTARAEITSIERVGNPTEFLVAGTNRTLGSFRVSGARSDTQANLFLEDLIFQLSTSGNASVSNVTLGRSDTSDRASCTVSSNTITCDNLDPSMGTLNVSPVTFTVYGDISIPSGSANASLAISLNTSGSPSTSGSVHWTDGTTSFEWVQFGDPVFTGTNYLY